VQRGFLGPLPSDDIRAVSARDVSRRNRNFAITQDSGPSFLLKHGSGIQRARSVALEAKLYNFFGQLDQAELLTGHVPRCHYFDSANSVLLLEFDPRGQNLWEYHLRRGNFSRTLARALGNTLGVIHRVTTLASLSAELLDGLPELRSSDIPSLHRPSAEFRRDVRTGARRLIEEIESLPRLCRRLDTMRDDWSISSLIHRDLKWDNCVAYPRPGSRRKTRIRIVDWELGGLGDPCWDTASVISDYLLFWLHSLPLQGSEGAGEFLELASENLLVCRPPIRAFLTSYFSALRVDRAEATERLQRTGRFLPVRLVEISVNLLRDAEDLTYESVGLLQLAANISEDPEAAAPLIFRL
jgi:Phosphotransferase enzyme family